MIRAWMRRLARRGPVRPDSPDAKQRLELLEYLTSVGCTVDEMVASGDRLISLASRRVLFGEEDRLTVAQIADARRLRRGVSCGACGWPPASPTPATPRCAARSRPSIMSSFALGSGVFGEDVLLQFTRVLGNAAAGVAEAALATFAIEPVFADDRKWRHRGRRRPGGRGRDVCAPGRSARSSTCCCGCTSSRRAPDRFSGGAPVPTVRVAVVFVDLVGSTQLTHLLSGSELAAALGDFERVASDAVVEGGGRVVKRIGDAVMFVATDVAAACDAALEIVAAVDAHPALDAARAAVAFGDVLPRDGDYFGTAVNLAARAVPLAEPGSIVVDRCRS